MDPLELSLRLPGSLPPPSPPQPTDVVEMNDVDDDGHIGNEFVPDEYDDDDDDDDDTDDDDGDDEDDEDDEDDDEDDEDDDEEDDDGDNNDVISSPAAFQQAGSSTGEQNMEDILDRMFNVDNRYPNQRRTIREQPPVISRHLNMEGTNSSMASSSRGEQRMNFMEDYLDRMFNIDNRFQNQRRTARQQPPIRNLNQRRAARQQPPLINLNQSRTVREQPPVISRHLNMGGTSSSMSEPVAQSAPPPGVMSMFKCPICMEPLNEETVTKCGHIFCGPCIRAAIAAKHTYCPLCRCKISLRGLIRIYMPNSN